MTTVRDLDTARQELLAALSFPSSLTEPWPPELKLLEPGFVQHLVKDYCFASDGEGDGLFPEAVALNDKSREVMLQSDIAMLRNLQVAGEDEEYESPFHTVEAIFPIKIKGHIVSHVWSGKVFKGPLSESELESIADVLGLSAEQLKEHPNQLSCMNARQIEDMLQKGRNTRDVLEQSIRQHLQIKQYTSQLLESERTQSLGSLSSGIAHHFNNLLSVILGYSSLVLNRDDLDEDSGKALRQISDAAQQGRRLTEEILAFTGSDVEEPEVCALHDTMSSVLSLLQSQASSSIRIESRFEAESDAVLAYPSEIRQIVFNLISSAMDGMPTGGNLSIITSNTTLDCSIHSPNCLRIEVIDSGNLAGNIPDEEMAFYDQNDLPLVDDQLNQKRSSLYGMVGRMRGHVTVSSNIENHTRVEVLLPLATEPGTEEETKARKRLAPSKIWVVDDDPLFRQMCHQVLIESGHTVEQLTSGVDLKNRWPEPGAKPDLLIIDFSMPEYNGLELREWLIEEKETIPVLLISGFAENQPDIKKALQIRHTYFLQKPFSVPELIDIVTIALGKTLIGD